MSFKTSFRQTTTLTAMCFSVLAGLMLARSNYSLNYLWLLPVFIICLASFRQKSIVSMASFLVSNVEELRSPRTVLWSVMYHDSIYLPKMPDAENIEFSKQLAIAELAGRLPEQELKRTLGYIGSSSRHLTDGHDPDLAHFLDSDLSILGADKHEFETYDSNIKKEYEHVPNEIYEIERMRILREFYDRDLIFNTRAGREQFEEKAKVNLRQRLGLTK